MYTVHFFFHYHRILLSLVLWWAWEQRKRLCVCSYVYLALWVPPSESKYIFAFFKNKETVCIFWNITYLQQYRKVMPSPPFLSLPTLYRIDILFSKLGFSRIFRPILQAREKITNKIKHLDCNGLYYTHPVSGSKSSGHFA